MFWKRMASFFLAIVVGIGILPAFSAAMAEDMPYAIAVDLTNQIVTVYSTADGSVVRQMLCSTGLNDSTPEGTYTLPEKQRSSEREEWYYFYTFKCYAKYATRIYKGILFHSIPYSQQRESTISKSGLEEFGYPASHGCIRLRVEDAQFIAENCLAGTAVRIYSSNEPDEELRALLYESSYTNENGLSYDDFLGIPDDPDALGRFSTGPEVEDLQYRLRALGFYSDEITGTYRTSTINAVKQLQKALGVEETGYTTPELKEIIYSSDAPTAMNIDLTEGMSGPVVLELQENLQTLSLYDGDLDSIYDVDVIEAVNLFQQVYGYAVSSAVTTEVQQAIYYEAGKVEALFLGSEYTCERNTQSIQMAVVDSSVRVRIRERASTDSEALDKVTDGEQLLLLEKGDEWSKIQYGDTVGYMKNIFLQFTTSDTITLTFTEVGGDQVYTIGCTLEEYEAGAPFPAETFANYLANDGSLDDYEGISQYATVNTGSEGTLLNLRSTPSTSADVVTTLANGSELKVLLKSAEWSLVECDSGSGYLMNDYLEFWSGPDDLFGEEASVDAATVDEGFVGSVTAIVQGGDEGTSDVFDLDSDDAEKIGYLPDGTEVTVVEADDDWSLIDFQGNRGYMRNEDLQFVLTEDYI